MRTHSFALFTKEKGSRLDIAANSSGLNHLLKVNPKVKIYAPAETFGVFGSTLPKGLSVLLIPPLLTRSRRCISSSLEVEQKPHKVRIEKWQKLGHKDAHEILLCIHPEVRVEDTAPELRSLGSPARNTLLHACKAKAVAYCETRFHNEVVCRQR